MKKLTLVVSLVFLICAVLIYAIVGSGWLVAGIEFESLRIRTIFTLKSPVVCRLATQSYLAEIQHLLLEFDDLVLVAGITSRNALDSIIQDMLRNQRSVEAISVPGCAIEATELLVGGMSTITYSFISFKLENKDSVAISEMLDLGEWGMEEGLNQLIVLARGTNEQIQDETN